MATHFTCPVLIQKNTREIRDRLRALGYGADYIKECPDNYGWATGAGHAVILRPDQFDYWTTSVPGTNRVNCGTNEELFFALAALRHDTDRGQWFTDGIDWYNCPYHLFGMAYADIDLQKPWEKATRDEIVEHFKAPQP